MTNKAAKVVLRTVLVAQLAVIAVFAAAARGSFPEPQPPAVIDDAGPEWHWRSVGALILLGIYSFPLWGAWAVVVAWRSDMPGWKVLLVLLVELGLCLTLLIAMLPAVS